ncbi:MAG: glycosyltransferase family 2 protein [Cetobacterium sp.]
MGKKVSILIPVYNVEKYLEECLNSAVNQTYRNLEIICINDGSPDNSSKILKRFAEQDDRIIIFNKKNGGLSSARNMGIAHATGEYIFHLDGDDYIENYTIEALINGAEKDNCDVVIGDIRMVHEESSKISKDSSLDIDKVVSGKEFLENYYFKGTGTNSVCNKLWSKKIYDKNKIFHPENISLGEDGGTLPKLMLKAERVKKIDKVVYNYRQNASSMTKQKNKKISDYLKAVEGSKEFFYQNNEREFFDRYENSYLYKLFYSEVIGITYWEVKKNNFEDYIIGWEMLLKNIDKILSDKNLEKIISKKQRLLLKIYSISPCLGDLVKIVWRKLKG